MIQILLKLTFTDWITTTYHNPISARGTVTKVFETPKIPIVFMFVISFINRPSVYNFKWADLRIRLLLCIFK